MTSLRLLILASPAILSLAGCSLAGGSGKPVTMADAFDLDIFGPHEDDLHSPYVAGAQFEIAVSTDAPQVPAGWTLSSSDPNVIRVISGLVGGSAAVIAGHPGQATLSVLDADGKVQDSHAVSVALPDRVGLYAEGPLLTGASDTAAELTQASVVAGGEATFLVRYFAQGVELFGSGALTPTATGGVTVNTVSSSFASARDFVRVSPAAMGASGTVSLSVDHVIVGELPITTVLPSAVTQVTILPQSALAAQKGESLALYAHALDATSAEVYGASFDWTINGQTNASLYGDGPADLFFYPFDPAVTEEVAASYEGFSPYARVHGTGGSVGSTSQLGCSLSRSPGGPGGSTTMFGLALAIGGAALVRRRRGAHDPR